MYLTFKYRLYPTVKQAEFLTDELREACSLYNAALEERIGAWRVCHKSLNYYTQAAQLKDMRADGCLTLTNFSCCQDVLRRLDKAFTSFYRRVKRGDKPGFPRFKSMRRYDSITFPSYGTGCRLLENGKLRMQGAGHIKVKLHRPIAGNIKTVTIKREAGKWYVCLCAERTNLFLPISGKSVGIDLGITNFAVLSDGTEIANPHYLREARSKLRRTQRKLMRRKKGSNRRRKAVTLFQKAHAHVRNQRTDFQHKISRDLVNRFDLIAVENLNVKGLIRGVSAKSIMDAGWAQFLFFLLHKAESAGREVVKVNPCGTSQTCICGERVPKRLKDRWHACTICGLTAGRDYVSAMVILQRAGNRPSSANVVVVDTSVGREAIDCSR